ncbi:MAG: GntR family transcriptional regulator [Kiritimatiellae bacterium]|nr:GntR family transcriptional regulator [Kiritimatiellia bacterium]
MNKNEVFEAIRARIATARLQPGDWLSERALEREYGLSRTPLREILQRLVAAGLLEVHPARGHRVRRLSAPDVARVYEAREAVEGMQARLACLRADAAFAAALRGLRGKLTRLDAARHPARGVALGTALHDRVAAMAGNAHLLRAYEDLRNQSALLRNLLGRVGTAEEASRREHLALIEALLAGDADGAEAAARTHLRGACRRLVEASVAELRGLLNGGDA